jgi:hypothetical protein
MLKGNRLTEDINHIKRTYGILSEQDITKKEDPVMDSIEQSNTENNEDGYEVAPKNSNEKNSKDDKQQSYRVSGGVITLHGKEKTDLEYPI